jgi:YVTN family beta-propeller protein
MCISYTYIPIFGSNVVFVIDAATNQVTTSVNVGPWLSGVAIIQDGTNVCFSNLNSNIIPIINTKITLLYPQCL